MKSTTKLFGIIALAAIIGLSIAGCGDTPDGGRDSWKTATYTVTFNAGEGSSVSPITGLASGALINKPADPTRSGYVFGYWYTGTNSSVAYTSWTMGSSNITLTAYWRIERTVSFETGDGENVDDRIVGDGLTVEAPNPPPLRAATNWYTGT